MRKSKLFQGDPCCQTPPPPPLFFEFNKRSTVAKGRPSLFKNPSARPCNACCKAYESFPNPIKASRLGSHVSSGRGSTGFEAKQVLCSTGPPPDAVVLGFAHGVSILSLGSRTSAPIHRCNDDGDMSETRAFRLSSVHSLAFMDLVWYLHGILLLDVFGDAFAT